MRQVLLAAVVALSLPIAAQAQMRLDVSGVGATQYPIAIANFATDARGVKRQRKLEGWKSGLSINIERAACRPFLIGGFGRA